MQATSPNRRRGGRQPGTAKTGGRKKGTPNKRTAARKLKQVNTGLEPLEFMLRLLRNPKASLDDRKWAAISAAPYRHARLASTETKITGRVTLEQLVAGSMEPEKGKL